MSVWKKLYLLLESMDLLMGGFDRIRVNWKGLYLLLCVAVMPFVFVAYGVLSEGIDPSIFEYVLMFGCLITGFYGLLIM